jgi:6-pyruvoyltetrahydropterin/6-carboxytetrahydropterin synthase
LLLDDALLGRLRFRVHFSKKDAKSQASREHFFRRNRFMPFQITTTREFSAAHAIRLYDGLMEPLHGHNWRISVTVSADKLDSIGVVMDFHELSRLVDEVVGPMHNSNLNDLPAFATINPTAENVAVQVSKGLRLPPAVKLMKIEVWETPNCSAIFVPDSD